MSLPLELMDRMVSVTEISQGKASHVFNDVVKNNAEYLVIKNNKPSAVIQSVAEYKKTQEIVRKMEALLEAAEDYRLLALTNERSEHDAMPLMDFIKSRGFSMREIEDLVDSVEIE